jgi:competence protein ComEC
VLSMIFSPLSRNKSGRFVYTAFIIIILWIYALITGLSPSVSRSAAMFTFLVTGKSLGRSIGIYNSLAASAFFLLVIEPNHLFDAGFQLSYTAVFSIVTIQPSLQKIIRSKNKIAGYLWSLLTVSAAAQIGTLPLTLYYFNQFPTYFLISGIYIIPAVTLLIPMGLFLLLFSRIYLISRILSFLINKTLQVVIFLLEQTEQLPGAVLQPVVNIPEFLVLVIMTIQVIAILKTKKVRHFIFLLITILLLNMVSLVTKWQIRNKSELIVYNLPGPVLIHLVFGRDNYVISSEIPEKESYTSKTITTAARKKYLKEPVYVLYKNSQSDSMCLIKNGLILFSDKIILFNRTLDNIPPELTPHILIDPDIQHRDIPGQFDQSVFILSKRLNFKNTQDVPKIYQLRTHGAFQKKW